MNLYLSILFSNGSIFFFFFFDGVTVNVAKQEGTAFVCKNVVLLLPPMTTCKYSSMPSNASVKSVFLYEYSLQNIFTPQ